MLNHCFKLFVILLSVTSFVFSQTINFQVDVITHMNSATKFWIENENIYAATTGGLLIGNLTSNELEMFTTQNGIYDHNLTAMDKNSKSQLILGSVSGNLSFLNLTDKNIINDENLLGTPIVDILAIEDTLWVLSQDFVSVYLFNNDQQKYQFRESYQEFRVNVGEFRGLEQGNNRIWLASDVGLVNAPSNFLKFNLYAGSNWELLNSQNGLDGEDIQDIVKDSDTGFLYLATNSGLEMYDYVLPVNLVNKTFNNLFFHSGQIFGADRRGVYKLAGAGVEKLFTVNFTNITDLAIDQNNNFWVSLQKRGIRNLTNGESLVVDGPNDNYIGKMIVDSNRRLWCSSGLVGPRDERKQGLFVLTDQGWLNFTFFGGNSNSFRFMNSTNSVFEDAEQNIWVSTWGGGCFVVDPDFNIYPINTLDQPGFMWVNSVTRDDTLDLPVFPELQNIVSAVPTSARYSVATDFFSSTDRQSIWIVNYLPSSNAPLVEYQAAAFNPQTIAETKNFPVQFSGNEISGITQGVFGDLWFATRHGVVQMRIRSDSNGQDSISTGLFTESDNLKINLVISIGSDDDGYVWVGTESGLNAILNSTVFDFRETYQPIGLKINDIFIDSRNNKWFATDKGLSILRGSDSPFEPASWIDLVPQNSSIDPEQLSIRANLYRVNLPSENIHSVFLDEETGDVYLGTDAGIAIVRSNPFATTFADFEKLKVGPNPFEIKPDQVNLLNFYNLVAGSEVKILTINGQLIRTLSSTNFDEVRGGLAQWDGKNADGKYVTTGVYVYLLSNEGGQQKAGKVLVVRR